MRATILSALLASLLAAGCLTEGMVQSRIDQYAKDNALSEKTAREGYFAAHRLTGTAISSNYWMNANLAGDGNSVPGYVVVAKAPALGLGNGEWLLRTADDAKGPPELVFASDRCISGDSCGCSAEGLYAFATAPDGHVVVLRMSPRMHEHSVTQAGSCSVGCGQPAPHLTTGYHLPPGDPAKVEIADVPYDRDQLHVHCMREIPAP
jgi:hypothetical protein